MSRELDAMIAARVAALDGVKALPDPLLMDLPVTVLAGPMRMSVGEEPGTGRVILVFVPTIPTGDGEAVVPAGHRFEIRLPRDTADWLARTVTAQVAAGAPGSSGDFPGEVESES